MDLFAITCTTCKSRLRVRDPAAVGQILSCPKCGGMVMVKPPPAWNEAGEQKSELPTAPDVEGPRVRFDETKANNSAFDILEELLSDAPPKVQSPAAAVPAAVAQTAGNAAAASAAVTPPPAAAKPRFVGGPPVKRSSTPPPGAANPSATPAPTAGPIPPPVKPVTAPPTGAANGKTAASPAAEAKLASPPAADHRKPPAAKPPEAAAPRKSWLLMAGSVAIGVLLAFTAVTAAIFYLRPANVRRPIQPRSAKVDKTETAVVATPTATEAAPPAPVAATESVTAAPAEATVEAATSSTTASALPPSPPTSDPLGLVKETPKVATTAASNSDPLAKFDRILGTGTDDPVSKTTAKPAETAPSPAADSGPTKPLAPRPPPREVDVAKRLADPLPGIETAPANTPLADFLQILSDLSTIPITLDVPFVPVTADSTVSVRLTNTTVGNAISEALKPLHLEYVITDDQLVVRRAEPSALRPVTVSVKDLTGGDEQQLSELSELLKAVVEPTAWGEGEGLGTIAIDAARSSLSISHPRSIHYPIQVRLAIEKLREARTPPLAHELRLDPMFFKLDTRMALAKPRLEKTVSLNYSQPTRLLSILERLRTVTGVRILVDWRDVAAAGWNPAGEATLVVRNEPLSTALDALLVPLDLTWRVIDGQTVQVVTPEHVAEQGELEFYKVQDLLASGQTGEELIAKIRTALGESNFSTAGGSGEIRFDEAGKCLLAWLPQLKQRELESLLAKWRGAKAG